MALGPWYTIFKKIGRPAAGTAADEPAGGNVPDDLAQEVERALARVLGPSRQLPPYAMS